MKTIVILLTLFQIRLINNIHQICLKLRRRINKGYKNTERKLFKHRRRRKRWEARRNFLKNAQKKTKTKRIRGNGTSHFVRTIEVPKIFSLITNRDFVLDFFNKCKNDNYKSIQEVKYEFKDVEDISHGAITVLLSITDYLNAKGIVVSGNYPRDPAARDLLIKSGFLEYFHRKRKIEPTTDNIILCKGVTHTEADKTAKEIRKAMKTVWGNEDRNLKMQGMLIELMANTVNHAYGTNKKGWYFAVDHDHAKHSVKFCFVDNGDGILKTIKIKWKDKIVKVLRLLSDESILEQAFLGIFGSRTKLSHRGKGLPVIRRNLEDGYIKNLKVISNGVYYDVGNGIKEQMKKHFEGTLYYWEIDKTCRKWNTQ